MIKTTIPETPKHFVDATGKYIGYRHTGRIEVRANGALIETRPFDDGPPPAGAIEVPSQPDDPADTWDGTKWAVGDRPSFVPTDIEIAIELLKTADPVAWNAKRQKIIDARKAAS